MRRREFITIIGWTAAAWLFAARAQQTDRVRRIGVLMSLSADDPEAKARIAAFVQGLQELGWTDGRNLRIQTVGRREDMLKVANTLQNWLHWHRT